MDIKLYTPLWIIKDPMEMLIAIGKLKKSSLDFTLLTEEIIGIRPINLFKAMKLSGKDSKDVDKLLYLESGMAVFGIIMKSIEVHGDIYRAVYHVQEVGNITMATKNPEVCDPELLVLPYNGLYDAIKEKTLYEYAEYLGFKSPR